MNINITKEKINKEFVKIQNSLYKGYNSGYKHNEIVLYFQWQEFYKHELELWEENNLYKGLRLRDFIYNNRLKYINKGPNELTDREILRAFKISGVYIGNSFHSPFYIKQFINDYDIKSIYDFCGGWGHRLLGAYNIKYIYNDINQKVVENVIQMSNYFNLQEKYFYCNDSASFIPNENYDAVFTCPPYWNTEIYSNKGVENLSYLDFLQWWEKSVRLSISKDRCKYFCFIMNKRYLQDLQQTCLNLGLELKKEIILGSTNQISHLNKNKRNKKGEILSIFTI